MTFRATQAMRTEYFKEWVAKNAFKHHSTINVAMKVAEEVGFDLKLTIHGTNPLGITKRKMNGGWTDEEKKCWKIKRFVVGTLAILFMTYGAALIFMVMQHIQSAKSECSSITESALYHLPANEQRRSMVIALVEEGLDC